MQMSEFNSWSDVIRAQSINGRHSEVLSDFLSKAKSPFGYKPDHNVLQNVLKSCAVIPVLSLGRSLHSVVVKLGHISCGAVCKGLLNVYAKGRAIDDCKKLFDQIPKSDTIVWNILLAGLSGTHVHDAQVMRLVYDMHTSNEAEMSIVTAAIVLPVCARLGCLNAGRSLHSHVIKSGWSCETLVGNALTSMYAKCGRMDDDAYQSFCEIDVKDVVSWNGIIAGFVENGYYNDAYMMFRHMLMGPVAPNYATFASILPVCATLDTHIAYGLGRELHAYAVKRSELWNNLFVVNALVSFYSRMGLFEDAVTLFFRMKSRDLVSWNVIISGFISCNEYSEAIHLFNELVCGQTLEPNSVTLISILSVCAHLHNLHMVKQIHGYILQRPILCDETSVSNALISSYAKCDDLDSSLKTFMMISLKDLISWNSILDAIAGNGCEVRLVSHLHQMFEEGFEPDSVTVLALIRFYGNSSKLLKVKEAHSYLLRACIGQHNTQRLLNSALLDAYGKCGSVNHACKIFGMLLGDGTWMLDSKKVGHITRNLKTEGSKFYEGICQTDLLTWNLMIRAFVENKCYTRAISLFYELHVQGFKSDAMTIMNILLMCSELASEDLLRQCHGYMVRNSLGDVQLKGTLIDVYSKCGCVNSASMVFWSSAQKDVFMFTALIGGYAIHGKGKEAIVLFNHMLESGVKLDHVAITTVLSACTYAGFVAEGLRIFHSIEKVYGMKPTMEQYGCVVDLLARHGKVKDAYAFVTEMPVKPNARIWSILLCACRTYHEVELSQIVADRLLDSKVEDIGNYVTISNLHAADSKWDGVLKIRKQMRTGDVRKPAGCSWM